MELLREVLRAMGLTAIIVVCGLAASLPITLVFYLAIERQSWLLGILAFLLLITIVSIAVVAEDRLRG